MATKLKRRRSRALAVLGAVLIVVVVVIVASGGDDEGPAGAGAAAPPAATRVDRVVVDDFEFMPAAITVPAGTTITWDNRDSAPHTASSGTSPSGDGVFDTDTFEEEESATVTVDEPGTYAYFCKLHPFMKATVTVE